MAAKSSDLGILGKKERRKNTIIIDVRSISVGSALLALHAVGSVTHESIKVRHTDAQAKRFPDPQTVRQEQSQSQDPLDIPTHRKTYLFVIRRGSVNEISVRKSSSPPSAWSVMQRSSAKTSTTKGTGNTSLIAVMRAGSPLALPAEC